MRAGAHRRDGLRLDACLRPCHLAPVRLCPTQIESRADSTRLVYMLPHETCVARSVRRLPSAAPRS